MRITLTVLAMFLLTACIPAEPLKAETSQPVRNTPLAQNPTPPAVTSSATPTSDGVPLLPLPGDTPIPPMTRTPDLKFDTLSDSPIITGTFCCGFTTPEFVRNYLPEFQIRADGRYIWVLRDDSGSRKVMQTLISQERLAEILQQIASSGFFTWNDRYANDLVADVADKCIKLSLQEGEKSVCEYAEGAPEAFHELFRFLGTGAGETGSEFVPDAGYLELGVFDVDFVNPTLKWSDSDFQLNKVPSGGTWIEGEALTRLWQALNEAPWGPVVEENGVFYIFTIRLAGLSLEDPPARTGP